MQKIVGSAAFLTFSPGHGIFIGMDTKTPETANQASFSAGVEPWTPVPCKRSFDYWMKVPIGIGQSKVIRVSKSALSEIRDRISRAIGEKP